ncbi:MAG: transglutaminase-like domain-containing protein [Treponema sp.]|jgi:hypothetical protein|nr:transglutaminase-like domain-containing protein [Treponema sp.]
MDKSVLRHYLETSVYTYAGNYRDYFKSLPDNIFELGNLICSQVIHRITLKEGNANINKSLLYGDMTKFPWYRMRCEDDILQTAVSMTAELFRLDNKGFVVERQVENKIVVTCRYVSVLMSAVIKAKDIPCRSRAGFAPYFKKDLSLDHWINEYWDKRQSRWVTFDADFFSNNLLGFNQYDIPHEKFDWATDTWLKIRENKTDGHEFIYANCETSLKAAIRAVFYDFHALMNNEISYEFQPSYIAGKFDKISEDDFMEIDSLAKLMVDPDANFDTLCEIWNTNKKYRILNSPLVGDWDNYII